MNREEAEKEINNRNEIQKDKFCPISNNMCNIKCVAYNEPEFIVPFSDEPNNGYVNGGYCTAYMLVGGS